VAAAIKKNIHSLYIFIDDEERREKERKKAKLNFKINHDKYKLIKNLNEKYMVI
jgi:hypothetical protein